MNMQEALQRLKENDHKLTSTRKNIVSFFSDADGYLTAKDLLAYLKAIDSRISMDTVYRNLHLYHDLGILEATELQGEKHFRLACTSNHHHHFICSDCGKTKAISFCPMDAIENSLGDFYISDHKFEVYGLCPKCQDA